jgi:hypothetical protein
MKRSLVSTAALTLFVLCGSLVAQAKAPVFGLHEYGNGSSELVLPHDLAQELAQSMYKPSIDPVTKQQIINKITNWIKLNGGKLAKAGWASNIWSALTWGVRQQMIEATAAKNYEAYGFKMMWGVPYWCVKYSYDDYTLLKEKSSPTVYVVIADAKFWVPNGSYFNYEWSRIKTVDNGRLSGWYPYPDPYKNALLREQNSPAVWMVVYGQKDPKYTLVSPSTQWGIVRRQLNGEAFNRLRLDWNKVRVVPNGAFNNPNPYLPRGFDML